jgi:hypothetical protein
MMFLVFVVFNSCQSGIKNNKVILVCHLAELQIGRPVNFGHKRGAKGSWGEELRRKNERML